MGTRAREEQGFGLVELLIAMTILNIALLALVAAFNSGALSIRRASRVSTATVLADTQMEGYRALRYASIKLDVGSATPASYLADPAYTPLTPPTDPTDPDNVTQPGCPAPTSQCTASRTTTGPDGVTYRVDTYVAKDVQSGRTLKKVTVVVRLGTDLGNSLAREVSTFDKSFG